LWLSRLARSQIVVQAVPKSCCRTSHPALLMNTLIQRY
jgi:hypothetical protein